MKPDLDELEELHKATQVEQPKGDRWLAIEALGVACAAALPWLIEQAREAERLRAKLERVRDFWKYQANSESGIVYEIDEALQGGTDAQA